MWFSYLHLNAWFHSLWGKRHISLQTHILTIVDIAKKRPNYTARTTKCCAWFLRKKINTLHADMNVTIHKDMHVCSKKKFPTMSCIMYLESFHVVDNDSCILLSQYIACWRYCRSRIWLLIPNKYMASANNDLWAPKGWFAKDFLVATVKIVRNHLTSDQMLFIASHIFYFLHICFWYKTQKKIALWGWKTPQKKPKISKNNGSDKIQVSCQVSYKALGCYQIQWLWLKTRTIIECPLCPWALHQKMPGFNKTGLTK